MLLQISAQSCHVPGIDKIYGPAKNRVLDAFLVRQIQLIRQRRFFNMPFQSCPAWKSGSAGDGELRVTQLEPYGKDFGIGSAKKARMKFPEALRRSRIARSMFLQQVFSLIPEMIETGIRW